MNLLRKFLRLAIPIIQTRQAGQSWKIGLKRRDFTHWIEATVVGQSLLRNPEVTGLGLAGFFLFAPDKVDLR